MARIQSGHGHNITNNERNQIDTHFKQWKAGTHSKKAIHDYIFTLAAKYGFKGHHVIVNMSTGQVFELDELQVGGSQGGGSQQGGQN